MCVCGGVGGGGGGIKGKTQALSFLKQLWRSKHGETHQITRMDAGLDRDILWSKHHTDGYVFYFMNIIC